MTKIVDAIKAAGSGGNASRFLKVFNGLFQLGKISNGPGKMRLFGINTTQDEDFSVSTNEDDKMEYISEYSLSRHRRKEFDEKTNETEKSSSLRRRTARSVALELLRLHSARFTRRIDNINFPVRKSVTWLSSNTLFDN